MTPGELQIVRERLGSAARDCPFLHQLLRGLELAPPAKHAAIVAEVLLALSSARNDMHTRIVEFASRAPPRPLIVPVNPDERGS